MDERIAQAVQAQQRAYFNALAQHQARGMSNPFHGLQAGLGALNTMSQSPVRYGFDDWRTHSETCVSSTSNGWQPDFTACYHAPIQRVSKPPAVMREVATPTPRWRFDTPSRWALAMFLMLIAGGVWMLL